MFAIFFGFSIFLPRRAFVFVLAVALAINAGDRLRRSGPGTPNTADRTDSHGERRRTELWQTHTRGDRTTAATMKSSRCRRVLPAVYYCTSSTTMSTNTKVLPVAVAVCVCVCALHTRLRYFDACACLSTGSLACHDDNARFALFLKSN